MRVFYGSRPSHAHRYQSRGDDAHVGSGLCIGIGGKRVDRTVAAAILEAVSDCAIEAALLAAEITAHAGVEMRRTIERELEAARYEAGLAARRHELVDPAKRHVARELETRWNAALERVAGLEQRLAEEDRAITAAPAVDRNALLALARDLPAVWNAPATDARAKQRLIHVLVREVIISLDEAANEAVLVIHWVGGRHTELRVARVRTGRYRPDHVGDADAGPIGNWRSP